MVLHENVLMIVAACLVPFAVRLFSSLIPRARAWGLLDRPGGRHIHAMPVAVVGGIGVMGTWFVGLFALSLLWNGWAAAHATDLATTCVGVVLILLMGLADDRVGISPRTRLFVELAVSALSVAYVPSVHGFCVEMSASIGFVVYPLTAIGITGVMNAMNLVDGMDGLAGSMFLSISVAILALSFPFGPSSGMSAVSSALLIPGLIAFIRKNWNPAVTFMGDHGSLCVGYVLVTAALGLRAKGTSHGPADIVTLAVLFSYPVLDMLVCMFRRMRSGQPVSTGDRNHMHHRMLRLGLSARESVLGLVGWQVAMLSPVLLIRSLPLAWAPGVLFVSVAVAAERMLLLGRVESARIRQFQSRAYGLLRPRQLPQVDPSFIRAHICIPLRPMIEAAQFEEVGCLNQMIEALRFFCERKAKGHGFVRLGSQEIVISLIGSSEGASTPEELHRDWSEALKDFSQTFKLTYSTWSLPVKVRTGISAGDDEETGPNESDKDLVKIA
jgi:UDP-GlcNAc:undecaprenyl-phosphate/decaprenyl-phosphate GlcNAc-1-phosphate transferase